MTTNDEGARQRQAAPNAPEVSYGRAGRNVPVSLIVGIMLLAVIFVPLFAAKQLFVVVLVLAAVGGVWEMVRAIQPGFADPPLLPLLGGGAAMMTLAWYADLNGLMIGLLIALLATMV